MSEQLSRRTSDAEPDPSAAESLQPSESRGMGREVLFYLVSTVFTAACSFAGVYIFTRLLPPSEMGHYAVVMATVEILTNFGFGWINMTLLREYPAHALTDRPSFMGRIIAAQLLVSALICLGTALYCAICPLTGWSAWTGLSALVLVLFQACLSFTQWVFRVQRRAIDWTVSGLVVAVTKLGLGWLLLKHWHATGGVLVASQGAATLLSAVLALLRWHEKVALDKSSFKLEGIKPVLKYGLPLTLVGAAQNILNRTGLLVLGIFRSRAEVGIYYQAYQLTMNLLQLPYQPLDMASSPTSYHVLEKQGPEAAARYMYHYTALVLQVLSGVALTLFILRHAVVSAVLDPDYAEAADLMVYLLPSITLVYLQSQLRRGFEFGRATARLAWYVVWMTVLNTALNFALAPALGAPGIALSSLVTYVVYCTAAYIGGNRHVHWPLPWKPALTLLLPSAALLGLNLLLPQPSGIMPTMLRGLAYVALYLLLALAALLPAGREGREHLEFLRELFRSRRRQTAALA